MKCKRHIVDYSSRIGVCASCLRERLLSLAVSKAASDNDDKDTKHIRHSPVPPLVFPRSVSPYVAPRKSDAGGVGGIVEGGEGVGGGRDSSTSRSRFFTTPQVGRGSTSSELDSGRSFKKKRNGLSRFSSFFRTRSDNFDYSESSSSTSTSNSWFSKVLTIRSKKQSTSCYIEDLIAAEPDQNHQNRLRQRYCRGMSPSGEIEPKFESVEESPGRQRRTPAMGTPGRRKMAMIGIGKSVSGMSFCLSPLVRVKPNCSSNRKGKFQPDFGYSGELKSPAKPHLSTAASFSCNRSKKLVDLGRVDHRR